MDFKINRSKGQITIFIIVAILIVVAVVLFFLLRGRFGIQPSEKLNPEQFIDKCVRDAVEPSVKAVLEGGGRISPALYKLHQNQKYNYLCYQKNYYKTCINTHPMLKDIVEQEIKQDSEDRIMQCFAELRQDLESKGFSFSEGDLNGSVELAPKTILIHLNKKIDISRGEDSQSLARFELRILSPLYELTGVGREIVNQEAQYCNFEYNGFMLLYPEYDIKRIAYDESRLYRIIDRRSGKEFKFAVRSCVFPPGL